jgi:integrase
VIDSVLCAINHWNRATHRVSIARSRQVVGGRSVEVPVKTRTSRPCVDLDPGTEPVLERRRQSQQSDGHPVELSDPIFSNHHGEPGHAESISQLFDRHLTRTDIPRIRFHDLRHTHASLLVAAGTPIQVVSERLGHAHPGFTMATYQHLVPGIVWCRGHCIARISGVTRPISVGAFLTS